MHDLIEVVKANSVIIGTSAGPLAASLLARLFLGNNRAVMYAVRGASAWLAMRVVLGPFMQLAKDNVAYLTQLTSR